MFNLLLDLNGSSLWEIFVVMGCLFSKNYCKGAGGLWAFDPFGRRRKWQQEGSVLTESRLRSENRGGVNSFFSEVQRKYFNFNLWHSKHILNFGFKDRRLSTQEVYLKSLNERKMYWCAYNGAVFCIDNPWQPFFLEACKFWWNLKKRDCSWPSIVFIW